MGLDMVEHSHGPVPGDAVETPMAKHIKALIRVRLKPFSFVQINDAVLVLGRDP